MDQQTAEVSYLPSVAALASYDVVPTEIREERDGELVFLFTRTPRFQSLITRSIAGTLHVQQGRYDAAMRVLLGMVHGNVTLEPAEIPKALSLA